MARFLAPMAVLTAVVLAVPTANVAAAAPTANRHVAAQRHHPHDAPTGHRLWRSGVYVGPQDWQDIGFGGWRGRPIRSATVFPPCATWRTMERLPPVVTQWAEHPRIRPVLSYPMWPRDDPFGSLADAAAGRYDAHFTVIARRLVDAGLSTAVIRLGWEFNGSWYPWSAGTPARAASYRTAWRHIVTAMRRARGQHFGFDWAPYATSVGLDPELSFPGARYVTEIGSDVYDVSTSAGESAAQRWHDLVHERYGLAWQARLAVRRGLPIAFPEWGLTDNLVFPSRSSGDDPSFIRHMHRWFAAHRTTLENYFDADTFLFGDHALTDRGFKRSARLYQQLFSRSTESSLS